MTTPAKPKTCCELVADGWRVRECRMPVADGKFCVRHALRRKLWDKKLKRANA